jgi:deoxyribose-phosphate aldolase
VQVKAAGGVRNLDGLILVRDLGATRCGASATATILDEYQKRAASQNKQSADRPQKPVLGSGGY